MIVLHYLDGRVENMQHHHSKPYDLIQVPIFNQIQSPMFGRDDIINYGVINHVDFELVSNDGFFYHYYEIENKSLPPTNLQKEIKDLETMGYRS